MYVFFLVRVCVCVCLISSNLDAHLPQYVSIVWAGIAQSVQRLATGWTIRGSNPGGGRDFPNPS